MLLKIVTINNICDENELWKYNLSSNLVAVL